MMHVKLNHDHTVKLMCGDIEEDVLILFILTENCHNQYCEMIYTSYSPKSNLVGCNQDHFLCVPVLH